MLNVLVHILLVTGSISFTQAWIPVFPFAALVHECHVICEDSTPLNFISMATTVCLSIALSFVVSRSQYSCMWNLEPDEDIVRGSRMMFLSQLHFLFVYVCAFILVGYAVIRCVYDI